MSQSSRRRSSRRRRRTTRYPEAVRAYWREKMRRYRDRTRVRSYVPRPSARAVTRRRRTPRRRRR